MKKLISSDEYKNWLKEIKNRVKKAQIRSVLSASRELIFFYWELGKEIVKKSSETTWGSKLIDQLSKDLKKGFPDIAGFSRTNLYYIKKFYEYFSVFTIPEKIIPRIEGQNKNEFVPRGEGQLESSIKI
ncbi:MAG: DUF1016 N-terminal domain-containing protein [Patescibacteria group bacterium]|nr:DUF1016 N-terminal domain-containing protein [Patescibacteria group bacterium]